MNLAQLFVLFGVRLDSSWAAAGRALNSLRASALAVSAVRWAASIVEGAAEAGTHLLSLSQSMGLTVEATQEWGNVAEKSGSNVNQFAVGLRMFEGRLRTFAGGAGGKQLARTMSDIGMSAQDARDALANPDGLDARLLKIADHMKAMGNTGDRAALARALFGARGSAAMLADMSRGSAAILEMREHFRELGGEITTEQAGALRGLSNDINDVSVAMKGLAQRAVATLAPILSAILKMASALAVVIGKGLTAASKFLADNWAITAAAGAALIATFVIMRASSIAAALASAAAWVIATLPIILLGALIGAVILIVNDLWVGFHGGRSVLMDLWEATKKWAETSDSTFADIIRGIEKVVKALKEALHLMQQLSPDKIQAGMEDALAANQVEQSLERSNDLRRQRATLQKRLRAMGVTEPDVKLATRDIDKKLNYEVALRSNMNKIQEKNDSKYDDLANRGAASEGSNFGNTAAPAAPAASARPEIHIGEIHLHLPESATKENASGFAAHVKKAIHDAFSSTAKDIASTTPGGKARQ